MSVMKWWQEPEWSALMSEQIAEDTLTKTRMYNADADIWRLLRPEDILLAEKTYYFTVTIPPATATTVITYRVPTGIGITFYGVSVVSDLGMGAVYELDVNTVKRQEIWLNQFFLGKGAEYTTRSGYPTEGIHPLWAKAYEQLVFVRQNDVVRHRFVCKHGFTGQLEFWPLGIIAGNRKQLLVAE